MVLSSYFSQLFLFTKQQPIDVNSIKAIPRGNLRTVSRSSTRSPGAVSIARSGRPIGGTYRFRTAAASATRERLGWGQRRHGVSELHPRGAHAERVLARGAARIYSGWYLRSDAARNGDDRKLDTLRNRWVEPFIARTTNLTFRVLKFRTVPRKLVKSISFGVGWDMMRCRSILEL